MFFKNSTRFPTNDSDFQPTTHLKPVEDNPYTKVLSGISMQPSLYPSSLNTLNNAKRDKTPPALRPPEAKKRTDMSVESSEGHNGNDDEAALKAELQDTKSKMKVITTKLNTMRKEKDQLHKENQSLQEEVLSLQASLRHMIPGFSNTSSSFPMLNELIGKIHEFYKCECEDIFFDLLCPELSMKGIIFFFKTAFQRLTEVVDRYFKPTEEMLKKTGCFGDIEGPLMNAMRKSYQSTWKEILEKCIQADGMKRIAEDMNGNLKLGDESEETRERIQEFLEKMGELLLCLYISDPPLKPNMEDIGSKVVYNPMKHEPLDGFIKAKEDCIVVLPPVHKITVEGEVVTKALVLQVGYEGLN